MAETFPRLSLVDMRFLVAIVIASMAPLSIAYGGSDRSSLEARATAEERVQAIPAAAWIASRPLTPEGIFALSRMAMSRLPEFRVEARTFPSEGNPSADVSVTEWDGTTARVAYFDLQGGS